MITLITGLPGACKTLYTLTFVNAWAIKDNRPVYYAGIKDLMLPWTEIDATKWFDCPSNSIIVIDECQTVFRPRSFGSNVPDYVSKLETHRHQGLDIVLITQHPMLCDPSIRRLAGKHVHCVRKWGMQKSTLHEWASVRENCDKPAGRTDSIKHHWSFDKKSYAFYKSAEVHTVKRNIPARAWMLLGVLGLLGYLCWSFYGSVQARMHPEGLAKTSQSSSSNSGAMPTNSGPREAYLDPLADAKKFTFERQARVEGLNHTAPRYDEVTKPVTAPVPTSCVASKSKCRCYSQQATIMDTPEKLCREIVDKGFFLDFKDRPDVQQSQQVLNRTDGLPLSRAQTRDVEPRMIATSSIPAGASEDGYGELGKPGEGVRKRVAEHNALTN